MSAGQNPSLLPRKSRDVDGKLDRRTSEQPKRRPFDDGVEFRPMPDQPKVVRVPDIGRPW